jgi:hypothetical protein
MSDPYTSGIPPVPAQETYAPPFTAAPTSDAVAVDTTVAVETKIQALLCHVIGLFGPLVIWYYLKRGTSAYLDYHGKEALNFQITVFLAYIVCAVLSIVAIGLLLMPLVGLAALVLGLIGGVSSLDGKYYKYPFALRLIK